VSSCMAEPAGVAVSRLAYAIGRDILAEINLDALRADDSDGLKTLDRRFKSLHTTHVNWWANKTLEDPIWQRKVCTHLGVRLLWLLIGTASASNYRDPWSQAFHHRKRRQKNKTIAFISMSEHVRDIIEDGHSWRQYMRPRYLPMLVAPYPWKPEGQGGYIRIRTPFVSKPTQTQKAALKDADLSKIYDCLNALNETAWRINRPVYEVVKQLWDSGGGVAGIPHRNNFPLPPRQVNFNDEELKKQWKREAAQVYDRNIHLKGQRAEFGHKIDIATRLLNQEQFYFPHQLDFRGRCYPIPIHLNHQGDDVCRGLLEFAEPKQVGERGLRWLKIHVANCFGHDKVAFDGRVQWTENNMTIIDQVARDPVRSMDWWRLTPDGRERKEAWELLAACMALINPSGAGRHLPVQLDGSCNGLQHYTAMGRDPVGAAAVNLLPSDQPADVYGTVSNAARPQIIKQANDGVPEAEIIADHLDRELVKQTTMTSVYGVTMVGARQQILSKLKKLNLDQDEDAIYKTSIYLSTIVLEAIGQVCVAARDIMDWLQAVAKIIATPPVEKPVQWLTPLGLPVVQPYRKYSTVRINTILQEVTLQVEDESVPVKAGKQIDGFAPNYVHSIDGTHMLMTARAMRRLRLSFAAVHDSYWTHASDVDAMAKTLREQFVELHSQPLLQQLKTQFEQRYGISLPDLPDTGDLDLKDVLDSNYFFS
jgi:DNA-directed RNA polymerase